MPDYSQRRVEDLMKEVRQLQEKILDLEHDAITERRKFDEIICNQRRCIKQLQARIGIVVPEEEKSILLSYLRNKYNNPKAPEPPKQLTGARLLESMVQW